MVFTDETQSELGMSETLLLIASKVDMTMMTMMIIITIIVIIITNATLISPENDVSHHKEFYILFIDIMLTER